MTGYNLNSRPSRNDYAGWVGMKLTTGASPLTVSSLGRICIAGNSGSHTVKFVLAGSGVDVTGGSALVNMSNCVANQFVYRALSSPITLPPWTSFYLVSQELFGSDQWYDHGTISTLADAVVNSSIYFDGANWISVGAASSSYVPPDFQYTAPPPDPNPPFVTGFSSNNRPLRNNFSGWVGMQLTVSTNPLRVSFLGRICVAGNTGTHTVKLVDASTKADVAGGSVAVSMPGCVAGQFQYAALAGSITLPAGKSYYLVSQEFFGGDQWYEHGAVSTSTVATTNSSVYFDGANWIPADTTNTSYVPPNMK